MASLSNEHLLLISKSQAKTINHLRLGAHLTALSGQSIDDLHRGACKDRFRFAKEVLRCAKAATVNGRPNYRITLARAYYAMYHAARVVVYFETGGDDYEEHSELPKHLPKTFPQRDYWENELKNARLERNRADYDPYPQSQKAFASAAKSVLASAEAFISLARRHLLRKGCPL